MTEQISIVFDGLRDAMLEALFKQSEEIQNLRTEVQAKDLELAKIKAEIKVIKSRQFDPIQLVLDVEHLKQELRELKSSNANGGICEAAKSTPASPAKPKEPEKPKLQQVSLPRSLARAALQDLYRKVAQRVPEAGSHCPEEVRPTLLDRERAINISVAKTAHPKQYQEQTMWKCVRAGGMDIRKGPHYARRDVVGFLRKGEEFTVVEERASSDGILLRIEGNKGWVFSQSRSGTFCQRVVADALGRGWTSSKDTWKDSSSTWASKPMEDTWTWDKEHKQEWQWKDARRNTYPGGWVACRTHASLLLMLMCCLHLLHFVTTCFSVSNTRQPFRRR